MNYKFIRVKSITRGCRIDTVAWQELKAPSTRDADSKNKMAIDHDVGDLYAVSFVHISSPRVNNSIKTSQNHRLRCPETVCRFLVDKITYRVNNSP